MLSGVCLPGTPKRSFKRLCLRKPFRHNDLTKLLQLGPRFEKARAFAAQASPYDYGRASYNG
jgi:hypothetical protein